MIRVEVSVKGQVGERVTVRSNEICVLGGAVGARIGVLLRADGAGGWTAGACSQVEPDELLAAAALPAPTGAARFLVAVDAPGMDSMALGADGRPAGYGRRGGTPVALAGCGTAAAEAVRATDGKLVAGWRTPRFTGGDGEPLPLAAVNALHCRLAPETIWAAGPQADGSTEIVALNNHGVVTTVHRAAPDAAVAFSGPRAYVATPGRVDVVTLATGAVRTVRHKGTFVQLSISSGRVAGRLADGRGARLDLAGGRLRTGGRVDGLVWLSRTSLLDSGNGTVLDSRLEVSRRLSGKLGRVVGVEAGSAYLASGKTLRRLAPGAKRASAFAELPGDVVGLAPVTPAPRLSRALCR